MPAIAPAQLDALRQRLREIAPLDRLRLSRRLELLARGQRPAPERGKPPPRGTKSPPEPIAPEDWGREVAGFDQMLQRAEGLVLQRRSAAVRTEYPPELPISQRKEEIARTIERHQVVVLCGETGSGKTTQLPKICLELGRGRLGTIGHTQPRRIAARSVAARIAHETGCTLGEEIGFKVRFGDKTSPRTLVKVMTDGVLLSETQRDRSLMQYDTIIIDEAHERSLNIDFMLGYLRTLLPRRPDLKVIVTSATIDPDRFARHFEVPGQPPVPVISVSGRTFPVEVRYRPPDDKHAAEHEDAIQDAIAGAVEELRAEVDGDFLVFLSGEREIRETARTLREMRFEGEKQPEILPLYARLSVEEQQRVFQPHDRRRIVLATNVAETSLTVPGIRAVIDTGNARISRYSPRTKVQRLEVEPVSKASAEQRKGRCGRLGPGVCVRLYDQADFDRREAFTDPEIVRANLAAVILQMEALRLGKVEEFPFVEAPDGRAIRDGYETLLELGAVDEAHKLTPLGHELAKLPVDPRIGRMILAGKQEKCLNEALIIAAALSVQDPRERPGAKQTEADAAHDAMREPASDFLTHLKLWGAWREARETLGASRLRKWCKERYLSFVRMREWEDVHDQLRSMLDEIDLRVARPVRGAGRGGLPSIGVAAPAARDAQAKSEAVHRAVLAGLLCNIGAKMETDDAQPGEYQGGRAVRFFLFPGSGLFRTRPPWVMSAEIVRTTKVYARTVAPIKPEWVEEIGAHLLRRSYSDPRWDRHAGRAVASERVTIFGLELVARRKTDYTKIDPALSRELFLTHALAAGEISGRFPFLAHNAGLREQAAEFERRTRKNNLVADDHRLAAYFKPRVPADICRAAEFERWFFAQKTAKTGLLCMSPADVLAEGARLPGPQEFPDNIDAGSLALPLAYKLDPSAEDDGITARVPIEALGQLSPEVFHWLVPGHVREKTEAILRGLGKEFRRVLPPAGQVAETILAEMPLGKGSYFDVLRERVRGATGVDVPRDVLATVALPAWMTMRFEVVEHDAKGERVLAAGRDLGQLRALLAPKIRKGLLTSPGRFTREKILSWDFGDLPERVELERGGVLVAAFPGIADDRASVSLKLFNTFDASQIATRAGTRRLFMFEAKEALRRHTAYIPGQERMVLQFADIGPPEHFRDALLCLVADRAFIGDMLPVRTEKEFAFRVSRGVERLGAAVSEVQPVLGQILEAYQALRSQLHAAGAPAFRPAADNVRDRLGRLMPRDFLLSTPFEWLRHYPRYLQAMRLRVQKLGGGGVPRDAKIVQDLTPLDRAYDDLVARQEELGLNPARIAEFRWMLEEFRVQSFAQELRTAVPVSAKRLQELWQKIVAG